MAFVCRLCGVVRPSTELLTEHFLEHGWAPHRRSAMPPAAPRPVMPPVLRAPPPAMAPAQPVPPRPTPPPVQRPASPPAPVAFGSPGSTIRMVPLRPNPAFWARHRLGLEPFVEYLSIDRPRPASPSPSFEDWIQADLESSEDED